MQLSDATISYLEKISVSKDMISLLQVVCNRGFACPIACFRAGLAWNAVVVSAQVGIQNVHHQMSVPGNHANYTKRSIVEIHQSASAKIRRKGPLVTIHRRSTTDLGNKGTSFARLPSYLTYECAAVSMICYSLLISLREESGRW